MKNSPFLASAFLLSLAGPALLLTARAQTQDVPGELDVHGTTFSLGSWLENPSQPGFGLIFSDGPAGSDQSTIFFNATRPSNDWIWTQTPVAGQPAVPMMKLDAQNRLNFYDPADPTTPTIVIDPTTAVITAKGNPLIAAGNSSSLSIGTGSASGQYSLATGNGTNAQGQNAVAFGQTTQATGLNSMAGGYNSVASGNWAVAVGHSCQATANCSVALGSGIAAGGGSFAGGGGIAINDLAFSFGSTIASGGRSTAFGGNTVSAGYGSFATGGRSYANGSWSATFGMATQANAYAQTVVGSSNLVEGIDLGDHPYASDPLFIVGNGWVGDPSSGQFVGTTHSNAFSVRKDGNATIAGRLVTNLLQDDTHPISWVSDTYKFFIGDGTYTPVTHDDTGKAITDQWGNPITALSPGKAFAVKEDGDTEVTGTITAGGAITANGWITAGGGITAGGVVSGQPGGDVPEFIGSN